MYYSQILVKSIGKILTARTARNKKEQDARMAVILERFPDCEIEVINENFIDGSVFNNSWRVKPFNFMEWWATLSGVKASRLAKKHLNLDWHLNLTKEQIKTIYDNHK